MFTHILLSLLGAAHADPLRTHFPEGCGEVAQKVSPAHVITCSEKAVSTVMTLDIHREDSYSYVVTFVHGQPVQVVYTKPVLIGGQVDTFDLHWNEEQVLWTAGHVLWYWDNI
jgi:hypothetical protein